MNKQLTYIGLTLETIHFKMNSIIDTHAAYNKESNTYTIVRDGTYLVIKHYKSGDIIDSPILVTNRIPKNE